MQYKVVVDSSANLSRRTIRGLASVPLRIVAEGKEYVDDARLDTPAMMEALAHSKGRSGTSCPNVGDWLEAFGDARQIFAISITSRLSGCYNSSVQAREVLLEQDPDVQVCCLDTLTTGPELALIAEKLLALLEAGLDFAAVEAKIREYMATTHLLFSLESLTNMARNGRVSPLIAKACGLLGIRVVGKASDDGVLQPLHKPRGEKKALEALYTEMKAHGFRGGKVRIDHGLNPGAADTLAAKIREEFPACDLEIGPFGGLCGFYAEKGGILVGFEG